MKKLFSSTQQSSHIGKSFQVGRYNVVVEDVIAEGKKQKPSDKSCVMYTVREGAYFCVVNRLIIGSFSYAV
jgi:hypothetical protein